MLLDQSPARELAVTHQDLADLLGVRRESISAAAFKLQKAGVIRYRRGHIDVLDRQRLAQGACMDCASDEAESSRTQSSRWVPNAKL